MLTSDLPTRVQLPFASSGAKNTIPVPSQISVTPGRASYTDGYPPLTLTPKAAGGIPPFGQDMNGILYDVTSWNRWQAAGGAVPYNSAFATAIGGYPKGAVLASSSIDGREWLNLTDGNTSDPDAGGAGWMALLGNGVNSYTASATLTARHAGLVNVSAASGSVILTLPAVAAAGGIAIRYTFARTDATANTVTLTAAGSDTIAGAATFVVARSNTVTLIGNGVSAWVVESEAVKNRSAALNGWEMSPGGILNQWGYFSPPNNSSQNWTVTFPIAFPANCYNVTAQILNSTTSTGAIAIYGASTTAFNFVESWTGGQTANYDVYWRAVGN